MKLLIGTTNKGKFVEMGESLKDIDGIDLELLMPADLDITEVPYEHGDTFHENARQKAAFYHERSGLPTLADDSGIFVEALKDELGIHTRRWGAGPDATDHRWIEFFLDRMRSEHNKQAMFTCVLCYIDASGAERFFEGHCSGVITNDLETEFLAGLPISACFKPDGLKNVYSALTVEEKNSISHRGKAMSLLSEFLRN